MHCLALKWLDKVTMQLLVWQQNANMHCLAQIAQKTAAKQARVACVCTPIEHARQTCAELFVKKAGFTAARLNGITGGKYPMATHTLRWHGVCLEVVL